MRLLSLGRGPWRPELASLAAAVGIGALLGLVTPTRLWPAWVLLVGVGLALVAWVGRRRAERAFREGPVARTRPPRVRRREYDLASDRSTDNQRYLM